MDDSATRISLAKLWDDHQALAEAVHGLLGRVGMLERERAEGLEQYNMKTCEMKLTNAQYHRLLQAARESVFASFWIAFLPRLRAAKCGEVVTIPTSPFATTRSMTRSLRTLAKRAGIKGSSKIVLDCV